MENENKLPVEDTEFTVPQEKPVLRFTKPERREPTAFEAGITGARTIAMEKLAEAETMKDFLLLTHAARMLTVDNLRWAEEYSDPPPTAEEWFESYTDERRVEQFTAEAKILKDLLQKIPEKSSKDTLQLLVAKVDGVEGDWDDCRLIGILPPETNGTYDFPKTDNHSHEIIYQRLSAACCTQAVHEVLGGEQWKLIETDEKDIWQFQEDLKFDPTEVKHNFKYRDENGETIGHRNEKSYLYFAMLGGFSNEEDRYRVTDYKNFDQEI